MTTQFMLVLVLVIFSARAHAQPAGTIVTTAGAGPFTGDGGAATSARLNGPYGVSVDGAGNVYIADTSNNRIRKVTVGTGIIATVAGTSAGGFGGDGGAATAAKLNFPWSVAVDGTGNVFVVDSLNHRIRKVAASTGVITTVAGTGTAGFNGDGAVATGAQLNNPKGAALDGAGNLYIADSANHRIRRVASSTGVITTVAGTGAAGFSGDGGAAITATLYSPDGVAVDGVGNLYIADRVNARIRKVAAGTGVITTVAGTGISGFSGDGGMATAAQLNSPAGVAVDSAGNLHIADRANYRIRRVTAANGVITTVAGTGMTGFSGDGGAATGAQLSNVYGVAVDAAGNLFVADSSNHRIRVVPALTGTITTMAGMATSSGDGGAATAAQLYYPRGVVLDGAGNLYIADSSNHRVRMVAASTGVITTVAGTGTAGFSGDGGPAITATLYSPDGVAVDGVGNLYVADRVNARIRKVAAGTGVITTVAGTGIAGFSGDGGMATAAQLSGPRGIALDGTGDLYIADSSNHRIRKVTAATGRIQTVAGTGMAGFSGDAGPATAAKLSNPEGVALDWTGSLFITDTDNHRVRNVTAETGLITTVAGTGVPLYSGDGGQATATGIIWPSAIALDGAGNFYIGEWENHRIRRVARETGVIMTVAGSSPLGGFSGDGGPATAARLDSPRGITLDRLGSLYIADTANHRIRKVGAERVGRFDFTGDVRSDALWRHATGGDVWLWPMDGAGRTTETRVGTVPDTDWEIRGLGDQNGDGRADVLWRHKTTGMIYYWPMNEGTRLAETYIATVDPVYDIVGTGDYNADGRSDLLWRHLANGELWVWLMNGATTVSGTYVMTVDPGYAVVGSGDVNSDGKADIIWRHTTAGDVWVWLMNGATPASMAYVTTVGDLGYQIVGVADHTGDGKADILWWHTTRGEVWLWPMNGTTLVSQTYVGMVPDTGYRIVGNGDYDGNGTADILWHHATRGEVWVWLMNGALPFSQNFVGIVPDTGYQIVKGK